MQDLAARMNIERFEAALALEDEPKRRAILLMLLEREKQKLAHSGSAGKATRGRQLTR